MEAENDSADKIAEDAVKEVDLPYLYSTAPGIIKRVIDSPERIT